MRRREPLPGWARRRNREREAERADRQQQALNSLLGLVDQDPEDVTAWSRRLVQAIHGAGRTYCQGCRDRAVPGAFALAVEPDTVCDGCGQPVSQGLRRTA